MKQTIQTLLLLVLLASQTIYSQDAPDGFATVSGKGVETTTGGAAGKTVEVDFWRDLLYYAQHREPYTVIVKGTIEASSYLTINVSSNKTIVGKDTDATLKNMGLVIENRENIIIRNLTIRDSYVEGDWEGKTNDNDAIRADSSHHIWIDHCFLTHCGDGLLDLRKSTDFTTVSYTHFSNHNKTFGIGWTDNPDWWLTIHHCWIDNTNQRNPSFGRGKGHLYNNYLSDVSSYGNNSRDAQISVQNSVFERVKDPLLASGIGLLYSEGNEFINCSGSRSGNIDTLAFDPAKFYSYTLDPTSEVKEKVMNQSGPQQYISDQYTVSSSVETTQEATKFHYRYQSGNDVLLVQSAAAQMSTLTLYDVRGRAMLSTQIAPSMQKQLKVCGLPSGVYVLHFQGADGIETGKIVIP